jgi:hypothetical protein
MEGTKTNARDQPAFEMKEPGKKPAPYYRLYPAEAQAGLKNGSMVEPLPPAIIPGTVIPGIDDDGVPQPSYTMKQAQSVLALNHKIHRWRK